MTQTPEQQAALEANREGTQFGTEEGNKNQRQNIPGANKPWAVRNRLRYLAAQTVDYETAQQLDAELERLRKESKKQGTNTVADVIALRMIERVIKKMEAPLVAQLIDGIEGKQVQPVTPVPPPKSLDFSNMTDEEAEEAYKAFTQGG